ncbi:pentatricopeptide repeat-containing protein At2g46050, mitochondrial [Malania oleifera]|uniref:pentatricopeptide repeat-containing protein At2g46050, mitochondrial n=1 Tax=Malania oleifera TaxID=397392 RepID=UPI0025AE0E75|nr:pentatricopeptide repeat-containing protein At2g46050, mitochondrial [Malania oleifera]XP_057981470.1 pentatricopeptide repeat-containing protein At2g46050, mitochondrial [Malania oleifera]XP_057981471.1 pentatricopeptide repeat-containing protein At2g46050, mitochondrial [Malania oleifera]
MISNYRSSIPTVHFKLLLSPSTSFSTALTQTAKNGQKHDRSEEIHESLFLGRPGASMGTASSAVHSGSQLTQSFCSGALKVSAKMGFINQGKQLHSHLLKLGYQDEQSMQNQLLNVYVKCKEFYDAQKLFDEMLVRNVVTWNTVICGTAECSRSIRCSVHLGFFYFRRMLLEMVVPNYITLNGLLRACLDLNDVQIGKQLHCLIVKWGFHLSCFVSSALVDLYAKFGLVEDARCVFEHVISRDLVLWNVMVSCYALNCLGVEGFRVFNLMRLEGVNGDDFTFTSLLNSFGTLGTCELGKQIHSLIIKLSFGLDVLVASALVDMYAKNESIDDAKKAFDEMSIRNVVSWTTMIVGYGRNGDGKEAMKLLQKMRREDFDPDELTLASILSSCANLSAVSEIEQIHAQAFKNGFQAFLSIANALINAYSKCGSISNAFQSFISVPEPDLVTWTSIIGAYAFHGLSRQSISSFEKMLYNGMRPDRIAFLGVLSACSHGGLVSEGLHYFNLMTSGYQIVPDSEHYTCLVDLLGRAGLLDEAFDALNSMPNEPESNTLGAFIAACIVHKNVGLAKWAAEKLFVLEPNKPVNYTVMSNMYACSGHWLDVARVRKMMKSRCDNKFPGCSWLEIAGKVHTFLSSDKSHPQAVEVFSMLGLLIKLMKEDDNVSSTSIVLDIVGDEYLLKDAT